MKAAVLTGIRRMEIVDLPKPSIKNDGDGNKLASLGVHEHWNNATDRQYTRNLGTGNGIELATSTPGLADLNDVNGGAKSRRAAL